MQGSFIAVGAPLGTPAPDIQKINEALKKVLSEADLAKQLADRGAYVDAMSPPQVNAFINAQQAQWKPVLHSFEVSINK